MGEMFFGCKSLENINLSKFNFQNVGNLKKMFSGCESLINIDMPKLEKIQKIFLMDVNLWFIHLIL